jgi:hypothetical protein
MTHRTIGDQNGRINLIFLAAPEHFGTINLERMTLTAIGGYAVKVPGD